MSHSCESGAVSKKARGKTQTLPSIKQDEIERRVKFEPSLKLTKDQPDELEQSDQEVDDSLSDFDDWMPIDQVAEQNEVKNPVD